jgi:hypothetical protein
MWNRSPAEKRQLCIVTKDKKIFNALAFFQEESLGKDKGKIKERLEDVFQISDTN